MSEREWALNWDRGSLVVHEAGATMMPRFELDDGRSISPLAMAPWAQERMPDGVPGTIAFLRGEWACVPFGADGPLLRVAERWQGVANEDSHGPLHGAPANGRWRLTDRGKDFLRLHFENSAEEPIAWVERRFSVSQGKTAVECELRIMPRRDVALPIGVHPVLRVPREAGRMRLRPGPFRFGITCPYLIVEGGSIAGLDRRFTDLSAVAREEGGTVDLARVPLDGHFEDAVQLAGTSGRFDIDNLEQGYTVTIEWDPAALPSCIVWYSNEGTSAPPWNRRHRALGIEPVCSALALGVRASQGPNPLTAEGEPTAVRFVSGKLWHTRYRISAESLQSDHGRS